MKKERERHELSLQLPKRPLHLVCPPDTFFILFIPDARRREVIVVCGGLDYPISSVIRPVPSDPPSSASLSSSSSSTHGQSRRGPSDSTAPTALDNSGCGSDEIFPEGHTSDLSVTATKGPTNTTVREVTVVCVGPFIGQLAELPPVSWM